MIPKTLLIMGGLLLMIGVVLPWGSASSDLLGITRTVMGFESDGQFSGPGGLILLLIAIFTKERQGKIFSFFGLIVSIICGFIVASKIFTILTYVPSGDVTIAVRYGLSIVSTLGVILGVIGSIYRKAIPITMPLPNPSDISTDADAVLSSSTPPAQSDD